jgi:hypothetical protein
MVQSSSLAAGDEVNFCQIVDGESVSERLWEDDEVVVFRRSRGLERTLVVTPLSTEPTSSVLARLERVFHLRDVLERAWATSPLQWLDDTPRCELVLHDPGGELLERELGLPWEIVRVLRVGVGIAAALRQLHQHGVVHRDIKPAHILTDVGTGGVWLTGFGLAARLPSEGSM